jgi:endogenous inhibitor of DNA gyrase (YacG/DUF329 family)
MRYLLLTLAVMALLLAAGCGKKPVPIDDGATIIETTTQMTPEQTKTKERLERPLFKREEWNPPAPYAGKCANCGKESDKLTQIDPFVKEVGGVCSEQCLNEWLEKNRNAPQ